MKRRILSIITALAMCLSLCPTWALAAEADSGGLCPHHREHSYEVCGYIAPAEGHPCGHIHDENCGYVEAVAGQPCGYVCHVCPVQALIDALPDGDRITGDNRANVEAQLAAIDEARVELTGEEIDALNSTRYAAAVSALAALDGQAGVDVPVTADTPTEQFPALTPGETYWFDLSEAGIPGDKNKKIPDTTLHWVPFTYVGTINAYKLTSEQTTTEEYANANAYDHSLFIADYAVINHASWAELNNCHMIFGMSYTTGGVSYTMRAPSAGSNYIYSDDGRRGTPQNNEWDVILNKGTGYIKNWSDKFCFGQDTMSGYPSFRAIRGESSARTWTSIRADAQPGDTGFRPVLELPSSGSLTFKTVTVDLNGGKIGTTPGPVKIVVKSGSFTAPSGEGLTGPDGNTFTAFSWCGSDGKLYAPGATIPAEVDSLTALWQQSEETPAIEIDYAAETLTDFEADGSYTIDGTSVMPTDGTLGAGGYMGRTISIVRKGNGSTTVDSDPQSLTVPARPNAPTSLQGVNTGFAGESTGEITGLTSGTAYQISSDGGNSWTDKTGPTITDLAAGTYQVRTKATTSAFTGEPASVTIGSGPARTYTLTVTAPAFDAAAYGYAQPTAEAVTIESTGNSSATISSVTVSGDFTIGGSGDTVTAGGSITSWTVQPNANLNVGTYTATITVTYDGGATATADVSFTVSPRAEDTPNISINYQDETLTGFETGASYTISGVAVTPNSDTLAAAGYMGQTISIVRTARDANYTNSSSQSLNVPARPAEPAVPLKLTKTANSITITNTSSYPDCEFSTDGTNWSDSGAFSGLTAGTAYTIQVRVKATGTSFRSASTTQAVTTVAGDGSTAVKPGESAETGGSTITNDGAEIIITGGDGTTTTITPPAAGGAVNVGSGGTVTVPGGSTVQTGSGPEITVGDKGGTVDGNGDITVPDSGTIQIGTDPATTITPPTGGAVTPNSDGTVTVPSGSTVQTGDGLEITVGPGNGGTVGDGGGVTVPDGGTIQIGTNPPSTITPPSGEAVTPNEDGTVTIPGGSTVQTGDNGPEITVGPGNGGTVGGDGGVTVPGGGKVTVKGNPDDTTITLPSGGGTVKPNPDGTIPLPGSSVVETGGTTTTVPDTGGTYNPSTGTVTENVHTVTFDSQGGSAVNSATATHGGTVAKPANPTKSGYTFGGWFKESGCTNAWNFDTDTVTGDITLYAKWTQNSGGGGSYTRPTYPPTVVQPSEGGGVTVSTSRPERGDTVTVKPAPENGYEVAGITVTDQNGKPVEVKVNSDGTFSFTQPTGRVKIEVTYKPIERPWSNPFTDVSEGDWYYDAVRYVQENGLMGGYGNGTFGPNDILSRAMLAQILYNKEGRPVVNGSVFDDVDSGAWCADAITWAAAQGIVGGYGNGLFGPNDPITREQLAVMLWRYAGSPAATNKELHFNDTDEIGGFALEAMRWAVENGILNGYGDGRLGPKGQATRAQVAQMLMNFLKNQ